MFKNIKIEFSKPIFYVDNKGNYLYKIESECTSNEKFYNFYKNKLIVLTKKKFKVHSLVSYIDLIKNNTIDEYSFEIRIGYSAYNEINKFQLTDGKFAGITDNPLKYKESIIAGLKLMSNHFNKSKIKPQVATPNWFQNPPQGNFYDTQRTWGL